MKEVLENQDRRMASDVTTVGGTDHRVNPTEQELQRLARLKLVQAVFELNKTKLDLMTAMTGNNISVTELAQAMEYKLDAIGHLRKLGVPDGFQGLKVWPQSELDKYYAWQAVTPNALNIIGPRPTMEQVQGIMDREFAAAAISPAHAIPWH